MAASAAANWECRLSRPSRYCDSSVVRESPELCVAGVYGVRLQLRPNINGKVEVGLLAPRGLVLRFALVISWGRPEEGVWKERGRFEGMHYFQGGWIRDGVAYSSSMEDALNPVIAVTFLSVEWAVRAAFLANELEMCNERKRKHAQELDELKAATEKEVAARIAEVGRLEALLAEQTLQTRMHDSTAQALHREIARLRAVHQAEVQELQDEISRLRGEDPALRKLDLGKLEELLNVVKGTQERAWKRLRQMHSEERMCVVCFEQDANAVMNMCGHLVACVNCADRMKFCPTCRKPSAGYTRIFR